jgi:hypothetical protein
MPLWLPQKKNYLLEVPGPRFYLGPLVFPDGNGRRTVDRRGQTTGPLGKRGEHAWLIAQYRPRPGELLSGDLLSGELKGSLRPDGFQGRKIACGGSEMEDQEQDRDL